jgi:SAM-dependent methyltransferase
MQPAATPSMNCDAIAPYYYFLERVSFGRALERARFAFLPEIASSRRALLCGDGDGRFLAAFLQCNRRVQVDFVDLSPKMVQLAELRVSAMGDAFRQRVRFYVADVAKFVPQQSVEYDLIVTHFFVDCFGQFELNRVATHLAERTAQGARWLVSDFREVPGRIAGAYSAALISSLYAAFRLTTGLRVTRLPDHCAALTGAGFSLEQERRFAGGLLYASLFERI